ncbi:PAAR repeat-containing protein [Vibrio nigripulchritudo ATCC 27043]|uniref:PAAR domain-containing protein n=1 Tax=Vibrio nigripulchritudo TaxID=28173 RepID=UPI00021C3833|nr:PAAR domain-containing protein [Vibrio nigripulchritudo]EGU56861.1 PAAR repeat-containing protein [Vibrio nigripulchritudo ATCC 27043]
MPAAARLGDSCAGHGCFPATPIIAGSGDVFINGKPAARQGDTVLLHACPCPKMPHGIHGRSISAGSSTVSINGKPASRVGDAIGCGGSVAAGSGDVFIGDTPYSSPAHKCAEGAAASKSPFLKITPLAEPLGSGWASSIFTPEFYKSALQKMAVQADIALLNKAMELQEMSSLAQSIITAVDNGADKQEMLDVLETNTTKAQRRKAREEITERAKSTNPEAADRFAMDMDAAEKAMLSDHVYTVGKPDDKLDERRLQLRKDFEGDSGWSEASPAELKNLGLRKKDLTIKDSNFQAQVYMPDKNVFGPSAKPVVVFRGTEMPKLDDWKNNSAQGRDKESAYYRRAVDIGKAVKKQGLPVEISGHSLGGGMGSAACKASGMSCVTFNAAGLHSNTVERYGVPKAKQGPDTLIKGYRTEGDILTYVQEENFILKHVMPDAVRDKSLDTTLPKTKSLTPQAIGAATLAGVASPIYSPMAYGAVKAKEKVDMHGMDQVRLALEERKVNDLHTLTKSGA